MEIRTITDADVDAVVALNEESVAALSPMDADRLAYFRTLTPHALVCEVDGEVAGFAIAYAPGTPYESINYAWHGARFDDFLYLDRIAIGSAFRRRGLASALYDAMEQVAADHGRMVCEIYSDPPNEASIAFHTDRGYEAIGYLRQPNGHETVMMEKPLERPADALARRCAEMMWKDDLASRALGMSLDDVRAGEATVSMTIRDDMVNGHGIAHGGFIFTLADSAFAFACNSYDVRAVAYSCDIVFAEPARVGERLVAVATERHRFGRNGIYDIRVLRGDDVIAEFRGRSRTIGGSVIPPTRHERPGPDGVSPTR